MKCEVCGTVYTMGLEPIWDGWNVRCYVHRYRHPDKFARDPEWYVLRYIVEDRIYFVIRVDVSDKPATEKWEYRTGWLQCDGMAYGGSLEVFGRWFRDKGAPSVSFKKLLVSGRRVLYA